MENKPIHITDEEFESVVIQSDKPVLVDFWAPWCGPCLMVAPLLEKAAEVYGDRLIVAKVNTDENPQWAMNFGVQGIPTMLIFHQGEVIREQIGAVPEPYLRDIIDSALEIASESMVQ